MSDPKRWIEDEPALSEDERRALQAGRDIQPPQGVEEALFASIMATLQLPPGTGGDGGAGGAAGAAGSGAAKAAAVATSAAGGKAASTVGVIAVLKSFALGSGLAAVVIAGHQVLSTTTPAPALEPATTAAYVVTSAPSEAPRTAMPAPIPSAPEPVESARPEPVRAAVIPSAATEEKSHDSTIAEPVASAAAPEAIPEPVDTALQESRLVARARAQVRSGRGGEALATLEEANRTIAHGILGQEREALAIEALAVSGRGAEAQTRARAFLDRFPNSPHAQQVRVYAGERLPSR